MTDRVPMTDFTPEGVLEYLAEMAEVTMRVTGSVEAVAFAGLFTGLVLGAYDPETATSMRHAMEVAIAQQGYATAEQVEVEARTAVERFREQARG